MGRCFERLLSHLYLPRTDVSDLVQWRPRAYNSAADFLCNWAMDNRRGCSEVRMEQLSSALEKGTNLQLYTDGGFRSGMLASTGWALYACEVDAIERPSLTLVVCGSSVLSCCRSSFEAEVLALDVAMARLLELIT